MTDDEPAPDGATTHLPRPPTVGDEINTHSETPWWQTIYQRSPAAFHNTPAARQPNRPTLYQRADSWPLPPRVVAPRAAARPSAPRQPPRPSPPSPATPAPARSQRRRRLITIGCVVLAIEVVALAAGLLLLRTFDTSELDVVQAQRGVAQILRDPVDGYGATNVSEVRCNNGTNPVIEKDHTFDCSVIVEGNRRRITVVFIDDVGTYEVQPPED